MHFGFNIRPGKYQVEGVGTFSTRDNLTEETVVSLYLKKSFHMIDLTPEGVKTLKKAKLDAGEIAKLVMQAKTVEEVNLLLEVRSNKVLRKIADVRIAVLSKET